MVATFRGQYLAGPATVIVTDEDDVALQAQSEDDLLDHFRLVAQAMLESVQGHVGLPVAHHVHRECPVPIFQECP